MTRTNTRGCLCRIALSLAALTLLPAVCPDTAAAAGSKPLLQTGELWVSERVFLIGLSVKKKEESPEERSRRIEQQLVRLRQRLVLATAAARQGLDKAPGVVRGLDDFREASLVSMYFEAEVRGPARSAAAAADLTGEIERRAGELAARAEKDFPADLDEALFAAAQRGEAAPDAVIARVAGKPVLASDLSAGLAKVSHPVKGQTAGDDVARFVLEQLFYRLRVATLAERAGFASRPEFEDLEMEQRIRLLADAYARTVVSPKIVITPEGLAAFYERNKDRLRRKGEKEIFAILVKDRELAVAIAARLAAGADFAVEAKLHTEGPGRERGGFIGFLLPQDVPPPLNRVVQDLKPGQTSPVVETPSGFTVLRCARLVDDRLPPLEEISGALGDRLRAELLQEALAPEAARLEAEIKVNVETTRIQELMKRP